VTSASVKYVVKTRFDDGHVTVQGVETDREEAEALADSLRRTTATTSWSRKSLRTRRSTGMAVRSSARSRGEVPLYR
jgi:hypothetical protein